ncbi:hypothetical protein JK208_05305 [Gluconobacter sp. Dm-74]|uniref:hypothetical protein n=1 Tax=Gluconobacter sp. Dm-74 TaxID=2799803 RepID=UPI001B8BAD81|nr:hypothetical protein [Gluconobacter sp. Dm-74]MBS1091022.1 hypothetical protein [Gluconobacter sp. Dm-74]
MGYIAESLLDMSYEDFAAWAFAQTGPGFVEDRITEAEKLMRWLLKPSVPTLTCPFNHSDRSGDVLREKSGGSDGHSQVGDCQGGCAFSGRLPGSDGSINNSAVMPEGYDIIDEKSGRIIGFHASNIAGYRLEKHVGRQFTHSSSSSVLADGESGDSVAADPRNDATPDTSEKGVRDDV